MKAVNVRKYFDKFKNIARDAYGAGEISKEEYNEENWNFIEWRLLRFDSEEKEELLFKLFELRKIFMGLPDIDYDYVEWDLFSNYIFKDYNDVAYYVIERDHLSDEDSDRMFKTYEGGDELIQFNVEWMFSGIQASHSTKDHSDWLCGIIAKDIKLAYLRGRRDKAREIREAREKFLKAMGV